MSPAAEYDDLERPGDTQEPYNTPKRSEAPMHLWQRPQLGSTAPDDAGTISPLDITRVCDHHAAVIENGAQGEVSASLADLGSYLRWLRRRSSEEEWRQAIDLILRHRVADLMLLDPFTRQARQSPWPIMASPEVLDFVYGGGRSAQSIADASPLGRAIFTFNHGARRARSIRQQRATVAELLAQTLGTQPSLRIAAIGCGYLRELYSIAWSSSHPIDLFLAADRDWKITASVRRQGFHPRLKTYSGSPAKLARDGLGHDGFHLIYSLSVLDTLHDAIAEKFVGTLASHLAPGGRLFLANSMPDTPDACFHEVFLGQRVFARKQSELELMVRSLTSQPGFRIRVEKDLHGEFANLTLIRL